MPTPLLLFLNAQTMQIKPTINNYVCPKQPYTLARFEPGSPIPEADAMSTAPCARSELHVYKLCKNEGWI
jgi:hypothetical protein